MKPLQTVWMPCSRSQTGHGWVRLSLRMTIFLQTAGSWKSSASIPVRGGWNGFSHQAPGFIDHVVNKKADVIRVYPPPDANTLLSVTDHCLRSRNYVNVIIAGKQPALQWLNMNDAIRHCTEGVGVWARASNDQGG